MAPSSSFASSFSIAWNFSLSQVFGYATHSTAGTNVGTTNIHKSREQKKKLMQVMATPTTLHNEHAYSTAYSKVFYFMSWPARLCPCSTSAHLAKSSSRCSEARDPMPHDHTTGQFWVSSRWDPHLVIPCHPPNTKAEIQSGTC